MMKVLFDTADITLIRQYKDMFAFEGVTTNPALIRKARIVENTFKKFQDIRKEIGNDRSLHMQVVSHDADEMVREAMWMCKKVDREISVKIPVTPDGMRAMKKLKKEGVSVTATTVVTQMQALLALELNVDYVAPYYDQMCDIGINGDELINLLAQTIEKERLQTKILAANIKNMEQYRRVCLTGSHMITLNPQLLEEALKMPQIGKAVKFFDDAWMEMHGSTRLCELES